MLIFNQCNGAIIGHCSGKNTNFSIAHWALIACCSLRWVPKVSVALFLLHPAYCHKLKWVWKTLKCMPHSRALHFVWQWQKCSREKQGYVPNNGLQVIIHFFETFVLFYCSRHVISFTIANSVGCNRTHLHVIWLGTTTSTLEYHSS